MTIVAPADGDLLDPDWAADITDAVNDHETRLDALEVGWTTYVPTLTNLTKGNGTITAAYRRRWGNTADVRFKFTLGTTSAVGTAPEVSLPTGMEFASYYSDNIDMLGTVALNDTGTATRGGFIRPDYAGSAIIISSYTTAGVLQNVSSTLPHVWAATDVIAFLALSIELA